MSKRDELAEKYSANHKHLSTRQHFIDGWDAREAEMKRLKEDFVHVDENGKVTPVFQDARIKELEAEVKRLRYLLPKVWDVIAVLKENGTPEVAQEMEQLREIEKALAESGDE